MTTSVEVRECLVRTLRRDLVGPSTAPEDEDLATEVLTRGERPSRWYLIGFIAPADPSEEEDDDLEAIGEADIAADAVDAESGDTPAPDDETPDAAAPIKRRLPSSVGVTALIDANVREIEVLVTWGDYAPVERVPRAILYPDGRPTDQEKLFSPDVEWGRTPRREPVTISVTQPRARVSIANTATPQLGSGALELDVHTRLFDAPDGDGGTRRVRAVTVFLVNRRAQASRLYADIAYAYQVRVELQNKAGFLAIEDASAMGVEEEDRRIGDLHYRDVCQYAVGRNASAGWEEGEAVGRVWTEMMPQAYVCRVAANEKISAERKMEHLAELAETSGEALRKALTPLVEEYEAWIKTQVAAAARLSPQSRRETGEDLVARMVVAKERIARGIDLVAGEPMARRAFAIMNRAIARAARQREAATRKEKPEDQKSPAWRPFQLAFVLLNAMGVTHRDHPEREIVDLLFFPTGGGKTEAYLGLAAYAIALRRLGASGELGAGVSVIMRYTLRLLTLDQLSRAAGVVCALELMRTDPAMVDGRGHKSLGDWPIEIGLWVGSDASPNRMGRTGDGSTDTALSRVRRYQNGNTKRAPAPLKTCPWCGTDFVRKSFACAPAGPHPRNLEIRCANDACVFTGDRHLPIVVVDEAIYRRLPAFLIATVDKFANLPWIGHAGAFFGHVDRFDPAWGFFGAADELSLGRPLDNGWKLAPPDLVIQDELHLISGPLGTVAGLYEAAVDRLSTREVGGKRVRPKIVASTATVRRAGDQISAIFDRGDTHVFPPPGVERSDSFFARTVEDKDEARLYLGLAAQGRGPKLVFMRALTTIMAAAQRAFEDAGAGENNPADPYMTAVCYFNALKELGGARRIVEDEVRSNAFSYGVKRRRRSPEGAPFADRNVEALLELTSRVSTDEVALAKQQLERAVDGHEGVDVALATNMISVGLDITRLGLMLVQGQPKSAAEYIQATSRVGRRNDKPGLVLTVLNLHKPRDRMHYEQFTSFHDTFYRAVEPTSVTPWAARALDRALAAVVVAIGRHLHPDLSPEDAAAAIIDRPDVREEVARTLVDRAPEDASVGGREALLAQVRTVLEAWVETAREQTDNGDDFTYAARALPRRLLHAPLDNNTANLTPQHKLFAAGRSMRDVEENATLRVRSPSWGPIVEDAP